MNEGAEDCIDVIFAVSFFGHKRHRQMSPFTKQNALPDDGLQPTRNFIR